MLGLDLSLTASAVASSAGWVEVMGLPGQRTATYDERLYRVHDVVDKVTGHIGLDADLVVLEGPSYRSADPSAFDRAYLWWRVYGYCARRELPVAVVTPSQRALYATGKGNAGKGAVIDAVARRWPAYATKGDDNAADAVTLLAAGLDWLGHPLAKMPATHRRALETVSWPVCTWPGVPATT